MPSFGHISLHSRRCHHFLVGQIIDQHSPMWKSTQLVALKSWMDQVAVKSWLVSTMWFSCWFSLAWVFYQPGTKKTLKMWSSDMVPWDLDIIMAQLMQSWNFSDITSSFRHPVGDVRKWWKNPANIVSQTPAAIKYTYDWCMIKLVSRNHGYIVFVADTIL